MLFRSVVTPESFIYARRSFELDFVPDAHLLISCSTRYKLYINGRYAGRGPVERVGERQFFDVYPVKRYLRPGKNVIAAICRHSDVNHSAGFLAQLNTDTTAPPLLFTDGDWRVLPDADWIFPVEEGLMECCDTSLKPVGWNVVGFDDSEWQEPEVMPIDPAMLLRRPIPFLSEMDCSPAEIASWGCGGSSTDGRLCITGVRGLLRTGPDAAVVEPAEGAWITFDFGRAEIGRASCRERV